jgi:hypothetical protein
MMTGASMFPIRVVVRLLLPKVALACSAAIASCWSLGSGASCRVEYLGAADDEPFQYVVRNKVSGDRRLAIASARRRQSAWRLA